VKTVNFDIKHYKFKNIINKKGQVLLPIIVTNLTDITERNNLIVKEILDLKLAESKRKFLILSGRREHLNVLSKMIIDKHPSLEEEIGFYVGGMKKDDLKSASEKSLIFATFEMASEGLDILALDTLFMLTPKGDVNQSVGRILRKQFDEYEYPPLIVDFVDEIESVKRLGFMRMRLYKSRGYIINGEEPEVKPEVNLVKEVKPKLNFNKSLF